MTQTGTIFPVGAVDPRLPVREDVRLVLDGGGVRAVVADGSDPGSYQAFQLAWSQLHPGMELREG